MTLSIQFNAKTEIPSVIPVLSTRDPRWNPKRAAELATQLGIVGPIEDAGLWYIARDERAAFELYQASHSFRFTRRDIDGEAGDGAPSSDDAVAVAKEWLSPFWPDGAEPEFASVTERETLVAERDRGEPRRLIAGLDVNVRFGFKDLALLGPGAKAKISVNRDGTVVEAYRFWRDLSVTAEVTTRSLGELYERFTASDLFADLSDATARAEVTQARFGYLCLPPSEPMQALAPVLELRGTLSTESQDRYEFIRYVAAVDPDAYDGDRKLVNTRPALVIA